MISKYVKDLIIQFNLKLKTSCSTTMMNIISSGDLKARAESTPVNQSLANGKFSTNASNWLIPSHKQRPFSSRMRSCAFFPAQNTATVGNSLHWSTWSARSDCENVWPEFWTFEDFFFRSHNVFMFPAIINACPDFISLEDQDIYFRYVTTMDAACVVQLQDLYSAMRTYLIACSMTEE